MDNQYRLVTESGKVLLGGETYSRRGAESWFDDLGGVYEDDETGSEERIYIEEVQKYDTCRKKDKYRGFDKF